MRVTIIKKYQGQVAIRAESEVHTLADLLDFTGKLGVVQDFGCYVRDYVPGSEKVYVVELV